PESSGGPPPAATTDTWPPWRVKPWSPGSCGDRALSNASRSSSRIARTPCRPGSSAPSRACASELTCAAPEAKSTTRLVGTIATITSSSVNPDARLIPPEAPLVSRATQPPREEATSLLRFHERLEGLRPGTCQVSYVASRRPDLAREWIERDRRSGGEAPKVEPA